MSLDTCIVDVKDVVFRRGSRKIFNGMTLQIPRGKVTAVMGASGTGKTTLLKIIGGQLKPEAGQVLLDGKDIHSLGRGELYKERQKMGMLFQSGALLTDLTVFENVAFPVREHFKLPEDLLTNLVLMKLEAVGLRDSADLMPSQLSGGMARRVGLARAIVLDPDLLMYDEPFAGQDPMNMASLMRLIREMNESLGVTSVVVSHDVAEVMSIADYVCIMDQGKIVEAGTPDELRATENPYVKEFLGL